MSFSKLLLIQLLVLGKHLPPYFSLSVYPIGSKFDFNNPRVSKYAAMSFLSDPTNSVRVPRS